MSVIGLLDGYLSRDKLCEELGVTARTIRRYQSQPDGLPSTLVGGRKLYRIEAVRKWLAAQERHPNPRRVA